MQLITTYAPATFLKPVVVVSTIFTDKLKETAICFVEALHGNHALHILYGGSDKSEILQKSEFIAIKKHRTKDAAAAFHFRLASAMENGRSQKIWEEGMKQYDALYEKYCPLPLKKRAGI